MVVVLLVLVLLVVVLVCKWCPLERPCWSWLAVGVYAVFLPVEGRKEKR